MKRHIRIIGDIHSHISGCGRGRNYLNLIINANYSVQLGDLGYQHKFCPNFNEKISMVDPKRHMVVLGNHDDYTNRVPNALGDFGLQSIPLKDGTFTFFYLRGARSIDRDDRLIGVSWWDNEELTWEQGRAAVKAYQEAKPRTVLAHDCPEEILGLLAQTAGKDRLSYSRPSRTNQILQSCWEIHHPEMFIFGHHHVNWRHEYKGTIFMCLDGQSPSTGHRAGFIDFDESGHLITPFPQ